MASPPGPSSPPLESLDDNGRRPRLFTLPSFAPSGTVTPTNITFNLGDERQRLLGGARSQSEPDLEHGSYGATTADAAKGKVLGPQGSHSRATSISLAASRTLPRWAKVKYYIPSLQWIPNYSFSLLGGDVLAGITVAAMLIPQSVSYASSLAGLSPVTGLFSASIPPIIYALLGTSRQLNVAPEAALSLLVGQAVATALHADPHTHPSERDTEKIGLAVASAVTVQVGLISFLLGFFRLGFIDVVLSRALLRGFVTAVAFVILIEQLIPMLGLAALEHAHNPPLQTTLDKILFLVRAISEGHAHEPTAVVSFSALGVLIVFRYLKNAISRFGGRIGLGWTKRIPEVLVVVIGATIISKQLHFPDRGISVLGSVPISTHGSHFFRFPLRFHNGHWRHLRSTTGTAVLISIIGFLDSIVAAKQNASKFGYSVSPNRELVALGAANLAGSLVPGTLPAFGSITRSRINGDVGGRTQMASLVCAGLVLLATFFLLPWLYFLPKCVLGSIICLVVFSLLAETPEDVTFYWRMSAWIDLALMGLTFVLTILWSVQVGVVVSLIISLLLVVRRSSRTRMAILGRIPGTDRWKPVNENPEAEEDVPGVLIVRIRDSLDFANTAQLKERLRRLELYGAHPSHPSEEPRRQQARILVFHMADVENCDASAVQIFHELFEEYLSRDVRVFITHLRPDMRNLFVRGGITDLLGEDAYYQDVAAAIGRVASEGTIARY
ncbi:hypothetical protein DENSPDRAFT_836155 [Dentipellis sp. KUC8613]|nr:hypothetical protein DENSPDRAFT_836155 [Dentipellis sp. KUC8613]